MKRIAILCLAAVLLLCGCGKADSQELEQLRAENAALREQLAVLTALQSGGLADWSFSAESWQDSQGASVHLTAAPQAWEEGQTALLTVRLDGALVDNYLCSWDGSRYTATADLPAADGYSYSLILTGADGSRKTFVLNSPDDPAYDALVYLQSSLTAYCNLYLEGWEVTGGQLGIPSGYVQIQLPRLTPSGSAPALQKAELVLTLNGEVLETMPLSATAGEAPDSFEVPLTDLRFAMPEMENDYQLELSLVVTLSQGDPITTTGGSWYQLDGELTMAVG